MLQIELNQYFSAFVSHKPLCMRGIETVMHLAFIFGNVTAVYG
jgi:hypothetical protein